jgi:cellulose synthase/poly-beta-1,6-N-acetylglucosamine synthase-like glycosyltransferase
MTNWRVLVTGGGKIHKVIRIGSHLVYRLVKERFRLRIIDNLSSGKLENLAHYRNARVISDNPKISIIIPVHNEGVNIIKVLESVKNISYDNKELIIVDDSDDIITSKLIEEWIERRAHNELHVKYLKFEKRLGASKARNIGMKQATSEFIFLLDADVVLKEEALLEILRTARTRL